jgi:hypothetical protein
MLFGMSYSVRSDRHHFPLGHVAATRAHHTLANRYQLVWP